jgi:hypothetical protein
MKKLSIGLLTLLGLLALSSLALAQSVAGEWNAEMETPGQSAVAKVIFKQEGEKLTGTVKRASGDAPLQGTLKGKEVKFSYSINYNGNAVTISISGLLEGDMIKGTADIADGAFQGGWMAKRADGAAAAPAQSAPAAGGGDAWEVTINSPQGTTTSMFVYTKDGENLKGALKSARGELPAQGMLKGNDLTIKFTIKFQDTDLPITLTGKVEGDMAKGEADFGGLAQGDWSAKRAAASAAPMAPSAAAPATTGAAASGINVTGQWDATVETGQGSGNPSFMLKQEGEKLTGRYKGLLGESDLTGTVKGSQIEFSFKVSGQVEGTVTYSGTTDGKTMKGKVNLAGLGEGTFTGTKK